MPDKVDVGFSWDSLEGRREVVGTYRDDMFLVATEGRTSREIATASDIKSMERRDTANLASRERMKVQAAKEAAREALQKDTNGFAELHRPHIAAKIISALTQIMRFNGLEMSRRDYVRKAVSSCATVTSHKGLRRLVRPDGLYMDEKQITKTAMDYAEYLLDKGYTPESCRREDGD